MPFSSNIFHTILALWHKAQPFLNKLSYLIISPLQKVRMNPFCNMEACYLSFHFHHTPINHLSNITPYFWLDYHRIAAVLYCCLQSFETNFLMTEYLEPYSTTVRKCSKSRFFTEYDSVPKGHLTSPSFSPHDAGRWRQWLPYCCATATKFVEIFDSGFGIDI